MVTAGECFVSRMKCKSKVWCPSRKNPDFCPKEAWFTEKTWIPSGGVCHVGAKKKISLASQVVLKFCPVRGILVTEAH